MTLLQQAWDYANATIRTGATPSPYVVEFASVLERTLCFGLTGNGRVIIRAAMGPLYLSRSLVEYGMPTINPDIYRRATAQAPLLIYESKWPTIGSTGMPAVASKASQNMHFGSAAFQVSIGFRLCSALERSLDGAPGA
jgi:hypothetical protein